MWTPSAFATSSACCSSPAACSVLPALAAAMATAVPASTRPPSVEIDGTSAAAPSRSPAAASALASAADENAVGLLHRLRVAHRLLKFPRFGARRDNPKRIVVRLLRLGRAHRRIECCGGRQPP